MEKKAFAFPKSNTDNNNNNFKEIDSFFHLTSVNVFPMAHGNLPPHSNTYIMLNLDLYKIDFFLMRTPGVCFLHRIIGYY